MPSATVVSICPFETIEVKPIASGYFRIPAAEKDDFVLLLINESSYIQRMPATDHSIVIPVAAHHIARSLVDDFVSTVIESDDSAGPGMMWFEGKLTKPDVISNHKAELDALFVKQTKWFVNLCRKADDDWNQFHKVGMISGHQRYAAKYLGYTPEWLPDYNNNAGMKDCPACFSKIDARAVVCINCKAVIDRAKAIQFGIMPSDNTNSAVQKSGPTGKIKWHLLASEVMDRSRAVLNDMTIDLYTNEVLLPYLKIANDDLCDELTDNGSTVNKEVSVDLILPIGVKTPVLPSDFIVPVSVFEKDSGQTDDYYRPVDQKEYLPNGLPSTEVRFWSWREQTINTLGALGNKLLRVRYYRLISDVSGPNAPIELTHALNYLSYHTAALAAEHIGQNRVKAIDLETQAVVKLGKLLKKEVKQSQAKAVRRRPFKLNRYTTFVR